MRLLSLTTICALALVLASCGNGRQTGVDIATPGDTVTVRAALLSMICHDGYTEVVIHDPWNKSSDLARLALVSEYGSADPPEGYAEICVPLTHSVVYSSVHTTPIFELGAGDAVAAVADGQYFAPSDTISKLLSSGLVTDIGASSSPSLEHILALEADAVLLSPMKDSDNSLLARNGIAVIPMADYMEPTPLGRAEWIKLLGALYGCENRADSVYNAVCCSYDSLISKAGKDNRPRVLTENLTSGVWYVPAGKSYMARMLADAGATYPWADTEGEGSLELDAESVLDRAADADIWMIRTFGHCPTAGSLARENPVARHIKAFANGSVYVCNTAEKNMFNDIAFHPERVLRDFVIIFHPEQMPGESTAYYDKMLIK